MPEVCTTPRTTSTTKSRWPRRDVADAVFDFHKLERDLGISQRRFAKRQGIPKTTFQRWVGRTDDIDAEEQTVAFFASPAGLALLHRIVTAAILVITQMSPGGIRLVGTFLRLSGLDRFAASSYGTLHKAVTALETELRAFGQHEAERLGKLMRPRQITLCQDETFHPQVCLVAIEPISQFVLVERYADRCDRQSWDDEARGALSGLPVQVIQQTADEGLALASHAKSLGAHHSPDLLPIGIVGRCRPARPLSRGPDLLSR